MQLAKSLCVSACSAIPSATAEHLEQGFAYKQSTGRPSVPGTTPASNATMMAPETGIVQASPWKNNHKQIKQAIANTRPGTELHLIWSWCQTRNSLSNTAFKKQTKKSRTRTQMSLSEPLRLNAQSCDQLMYWSVSRSWRSDPGRQCPCLAGTKDPALHSKIKFHHVVMWASCFASSVWDWLDST